MKSLLEPDVIVLNIAKHCHIEDLRTMSTFKPHLIFWHREWHKNGQLWWEVPYVNGEQHGVEKHWYGDGQLACETPYVNGEIHGMRKMWYSNGRLVYIITYVHGEQHGEKWWPLMAIHSRRLDE